VRFVTTHYYVHFPCQHNVLLEVWLSAIIQLLYTVVVDKQVVNTVMYKIDL